MRARAVLNQPSPLLAGKFEKRRLSPQRIVTSLNT